MKDKVDARDCVNKTQKHFFWTWNRFWQIMALAGVVAFSVLLVMNRSRVTELGAYGYLGAFLISLLASASIVVPVPALIVVAALGAVLNPLLIGLVSGIGGTIGELTGYGLGYGGRIALERVTIYPKMVKWMTRWGPLTVFVLALVPNPLFDIAGATAGALRMPVWKFLLFGALGRIPKNIAFAFLGTWAVQNFPFG